MMANRKQGSAWQNPQLLSYTVTVQHIKETRDGTLTEWLTPHITTLSRGSLARNSFTFWATKCFFLVLVLLAIDAAMLLAEAIFR